MYLKKSYEKRIVSFWSLVVLVQNNDSFNLSPTLPATVHKLMRHELIPEPEFTFRYFIHINETHRAPFKLLGRDQTAIKFYERC